MLRMQTREHDPRTVYVAVYDTWADWEVGHAIAHINKPLWQRRPGRYQVRTAGTSLGPVTTSGGVRITPDVVLTEGSVPDEAALLILAGADLWDTSDDLAGFARLARAFLEAGVPVAA